MRILLVTDTHLAAGRPDAIAHWRAAQAFAARGGIGLTIHLGDITRDAWSAPEELDFVAGLARDWPTPLRFIPGNHDVGDNPPGEGLPCKQPLSGDLLARYRGLFGEDRWAMDIAGADGEPAWRLIGLNAQLFGTETGDEKAQWEWLSDAVEDADGLRLAVFSHKPLFQNALEDEPPHGRYLPSVPRRRVLDLLSKADWRLWLSGHTHQHLDRAEGGARHVWVPSLAFRFPDDMQETIGQKIVGAAVLTLGDAWAEVDVVVPEGTRQITFNPKLEAV